MVKTEDYFDNEKFLDDKANVPRVEPPDLKPVLANDEKSFPSSSSGHLKSYFVGMGFSPTLVDKVIAENGGDDAEVLLETLFTYSALEKSSPGGTDSLSCLPSPGKEEVDSPLEFTTDEEQEDDKPVDVGLDKKSHLLMMKFSPVEVDLAISRLGENASLAELVDFIIAAQTTGLSPKKKANGSSYSDEETTVETLFGTMDKTIHLLQMGFTEEEVSYAIDRFGQNAPVRKLTESILSKRMANKVVKEEEDTLDDQNNIGLQNHYESQWLDNNRNGYLNSSIPDPRMWKSNESSSDDKFCDFDEIKRVKKAKYSAVDLEPASCSNHKYSSNPIYNEFRNPAEAGLIKEEMPDISAPNLQGNARGFLSRPPYFFYGNVVDVPHGTWRKLSQFLYGTEPEHVNTMYFSALIRKEGYVHNLPTEKRFHVLPKSPMSLEDALPDTKKWWPSWDTRKQLNCVSCETTGVAQLCERLGRMVTDSNGILSREQQMDILHHCKRLNLMWVGRNKLSPIEPDYVERIFGYPLQHTEIWGIDAVDRLRALKYCFQTDTLGYHLSVLKRMYPGGLRVLSLYSGIGGAEVALHRLGIRLKCVVSVESCEINRKILRRWWHKTEQSGELEQIAGIDKLTSIKLESLLRQFGGFDIVIGANPGTHVSGSSIGDISMGMDLSLFFEFVRVFQRVRSMMGKNR